MRMTIVIFILTAVLSIGYSFGETDGAERRERVSRAEMKLVQSRAVQAATSCDHLITERAEK